MPLKAIKYSLLALLWLMPKNSFAQKENHNWYFGDYIGINFNTQPPSALTDSKMTTIEGSASISNSKGQLLFYTNGVSVWDRNHNLMPNGDSLKGDVSSTQSAQIIPVPDSSHLYYIFTAAAWGSDIGLNYSVVNINLNGGTGDIVSSKKNIFVVGPISEKLAAIQKPNRKEFWLLVHKYHSDTLLAYSVSANGINTDPVVSKTGLVVKPRFSEMSFIGAMKISPNGKKIAMVHNGKDTIVIGDFDVNTGKASNWWHIKQQYNPYGVEFSPKSNFLYVSAENAEKCVLQFDLNTSSPEDFLASRKGIFFDDWTWIIGALQLGPDGKIYVCIKSKRSVSVIHAPDSAGMACRPEVAYITYPYEPERITELGLPAFIAALPPQKWIINSDTTICIGDSALLTCTKENVKSIVWSNGSTDFKIFVKQPGKYWVTVTDSADFVFVDTVTVDVGPKFKVYIGPDTAFCGKFSYLIKATPGFAKYQWNTGQNSSQITVDSHGIYTVKVLDDNSCPSGDTTIISYCEALTYFIPNSFTPNNDNRNDVFQVKGANISNIEMSIYNRWGEKIYESSGKDVSWNGKYNEVPCPEDVYIFKLKITGTNREEVAFESGNVTLLRR